jgi:hypothetical protein
MVTAYQRMQAHIAAEARTASTMASSGWSMDVDTRIRHLDPLFLPAADGADNRTKTLRGILDSNVSGTASSKPLLDLFYEDKDLDVAVDKGFYQKPFIGAAVMAIFAESLNNPASHATTECGLRRFQNQDVRFFLCGSLHGGTGACGLPVIGRFLRDQKGPNDRWRIGAGLLAPYCRPVDPPFGKLAEGDPLTREVLQSAVAKLDRANPKFADLSADEKEELARQILLGFYADPNDLEARTAQSLAYFKEYVARYFDAVYVLGKRKPDPLTVWSNGGRTQENPANTAEVVAAVAALDFFCGDEANTGSFLVPSTAREGSERNKDGKSRLGDLPLYRIGAGLPVDLERVLLATSAMHHLVMRQIPWNVRAKEWPGLEPLRQLYEKDDDRMHADHQNLTRGLDIVAQCVYSLISPSTTLGWDGSDFSAVRAFYSAEQADVAAITEKIRTKRTGPLKIYRGKGPEEALHLGRSVLPVTAAEFGQWDWHGGPFSRGYYLRSVWSRLHASA